MRKTKTSRCGIITLLLFLISSCFNTLHEAKKNMQRVSFSFTSPDGIRDNHAFSFSTQVFISEFESFRIYELPYHEIQEEDNKSAYDSIKYNCFIHRLNDTIGYYFKKIGDTNYIRCSNDSVLVRAYNRGRRYEGDVLNGLKIIKSDSLEIDNNSKLLYRYFVEDKIYDSIYLYYDKSLSSMNFTISAFRDSLSKAKLYKVRYFIKNQIQGANIPDNFYENVLEIKYAPSENENQIIRMIRNIVQAETRECP